MLFVMPVLATFLYALMTVIPVRRGTINLPFEVREENWPRQVELTRNLILWLRAELTVLFTYICWTMIQNALGHGEGLGPGLIVIIVGGSLLTTAIFLRLCWNAR